MMPRMPRHQLLRRSPLALLATTAAALVLAASLTLSAQPPGQGGSTKSPDEDTFKPEKIENLTVLPKTTTPDQLMTIMRSWSESLNVGCVFCHKGKLGAPLATFDFKDDAKDHHAVTRNMLTMTNDLNTKYAEGMGDDATLETPKVTCATCHRRKRKPEAELPPAVAKPGL